MSGENEREGSVVNASMRTLIPHSARRLAGAVTVAHQRRDGQVASATGDAGWSRWRRLGANRSLSWWCSRTTSPTVVNVRAGRGQPRRARRAGSVGPPAACRPPDPARFQVVVPTERPGCRSRDSSVHQDKLEAVGDLLPPQVLQHQFRRPVLMAGSRHHQSTHREPGHVDGHDALGAFGPAVAAAAAGKGEPTVRCPAGQMGVDDHHRRRRLAAPRDLARRRVQHCQRSRPRAVS